MSLYFTSCPSIAVGRLAVERVGEETERPYPLRRGMYERMDNGARVVV